MPLRTGGRPARTLAEHEAELQQRMDRLHVLIGSKWADAGTCRAAASLVRSGCDAYMRRLDVEARGETDG